MIVNRQRRVRVPVAQLNRFASLAQRRLRIPAEAVTIALVTDAEMKRWNRAFHGKNRATDVLSFPADDARGGKSPASGYRKRPQKHSGSSRRASARTPSQQKLGAVEVDFYLGDIAIAPAVARVNARRFGRAFVQELRILILHGILHLMGYDHETDEGQMERRET